jgi:hypothetical protein
MGQNYTIQELRSKSHDKTDIPNGLIQKTRKISYKFNEPRNLNIQVAFESYLLLLTTKRVTMGVGIPVFQE